MFGGVDDILRLLGYCHTLVLSVHELLMELDETEGLMAEELEESQKEKCIPSNFCETHH